MPTPRRERIGVLGPVAFVLACGQLHGSAQTDEPAPAPVIAAPGDSEDPDVEEPPPPPIPGVSLRLALPIAVWDTGTVPDLQLSFVNASVGDIQIGSPIEGSWDGARRPRYVLELVDETGAVVPDAIGPPPALCATVPHFRDGVDDLTVAPGGTADAYHSPHAARFPREVNGAARPGNYMARVRYTAIMSEVTAMTAVSNSVPVEIRGGSMSKWTCYRELLEKQRADRYARFEVELRPTDVVAVGDRFAAVYLREELRRVDSQPSERYDLGVQLFGDRGLIGAPATLKVPEYVLLARAAATDDGLLVAYGIGSFEGHVGLVAASITGDRVRLGAPESLAGGLTIAPSLAIERSGATIVVAYVRDLGEGKEDLVIHTRSAATGAVQTPLAVLAANARDLRDLQLARAGKDGFLLVWSERERILAATLDARGQPRGRPFTLGERVGAVRAARARSDGGLEIAYFEDTPGYGDDRRPQGFYLQDYAASGTPLRARRALAPTGDYDFFWGDLAWGQSAAVRAYVAPIPPLRPREYVSAPLQFGPVGAEPRTLSASSSGQPVLAARGDEFAVAWSDSRHDTTRACVRGGECVGEVYVSIQRPAGARLPPTRATRDSVPAAVASFAGERWQELCD